MRMTSAASPGGVAAYAASTQALPPGVVRRRGFAMRPISSLCFSIGCPCDHGLPSWIHKDGSRWAPGAFMTQGTIEICLSNLARAAKVGSIGLGRRFTGRGDMRDGRA